MQRKWTETPAHELASELRSCAEILDGRPNGYGITELLHRDAHGAILEALRRLELPGHYVTRDNAPARYEQVIGRHARLNTLIDKTERAAALLPADTVHLGAVLEHLRNERAAVRRELERQHEAREAARLDREDAAELAELEEANNARSDAIGE